GMGSGTGLKLQSPSFGDASERGIQKQPVPRLDSAPTPSARPATTERPGLRPPPDNSFERRADRRGEHTARKSVTQGSDEAPQRGYGARGPLLGPELSQSKPLEISAELRKALGYDGDPSKPLIGGDQSEEDATDAASPSPAGGGSRGEGARGGVT